MELPVGILTLCPIWAVKHECVFVEFLRLRAKELTSGELTAVACTVGYFEKVRSTFPGTDAGLLTPSPENNIMVERPMTLGEIDDCLASCATIIDHLPSEFFQHVRDVTGLEDQLRKQWKLLDATNKLQGATNWKGNASPDKKVTIHTTIADLINMRNNFVLLIKNKSKQFLSFDAMLCACRGFKAIEDLENSVPGFPSSQRQDVEYDRVKLNDIDLPQEYLAEIRDMAIPESLVGPLKDTTQMCAGNDEVMKRLGCFKKFLSLPGDPTTQDTVYSGVGDPAMEIDCFLEVLDKVK